MLGKTAGGLFWMYRYLERAENTARLIETGQRIALTRSGAGDEEWRSVMQSAGVLAGFNETGNELTRDGAVDWMLRNRENSSSVLSCIEGARQNARMVRTALTMEVWEAMNATYMLAKKLLARRVSERDLPSILGAMRQRTALVRGSTHGTMLRNDIYNFARIGTFLERADATSRILDVKYYVLLPSINSVGSSLDNVQWETILRSVSARGGFRMQFGASAAPRDIAQFLILDTCMPRSLAFCTGKIADNLGYVCLSYGERSKAMDKAQALAADCRNTDIETIFADGLHEYIQGILDRLTVLGGQIEHDYRFYE